MDFLYRLLFFAVDFVVFFFVLFDLLIQFLIFSLKPVLLLQHHLQFYVSLFFGLLGLRQLLTQRELQAFSFFPLIIFEFLGLLKAIYLLILGLVLGGVLLLKEYLLLVIS